MKFPSSLPSHPNPCSKRRLDDNLDAVKENPQVDTTKVPKETPLTHRPIPKIDISVLLEPRNKSRDQPTEVHHLFGIVRKTKPLGAFRVSFDPLRYP